MSEAFDVLEAAFTLCNELSREHRAHMPQPAFDAIRRALQLAHDAGVNAQPTTSDMRNSKRFQWLVDNIKPQRTGQYWFKPAPYPGPPSAEVIAANDIAGHQLPVMAWRWTTGYPSLAESIDGMLAREAPTRNSST